MSAGLGVAEFLVIGVMVLVLFIALPLGIYLIVRKASADGARGAANRRGEQR